MTEDELATIILSLSMLTKPEALKAIALPIACTDFDSLDLELLRTRIERQLGHEIADAVWQEAPSLRALLAALAAPPTPVARNEGTHG